MGFVMGLVACGVVITLLAWCVSRLDRGGRRAERAGLRPRPNPLCWFVGSTAALVGLVGVASGVQAVRAVPDEFHGSGPQNTADGVSLVFWGVVILVNGVYVWRGARRRGLRDRVGRLLIIVGYVVLGVAVQQATHQAVELWRTPVDEGDDVLNRAMLALLGWGVPAAALVWVGVKLARERILLTVSAQAGY